MYCKGSSWSVIRRHWLHLIAIVFLVPLLASCQTSDTPGWSLNKAKLATAETALASTHHDGYWKGNINCTEANGDQWSGGRTMTIENGMAKLEFEVEKPSGIHLESLSGKVVGDALYLFGIVDYMYGDIGPYWYDGAFQGNKYSGDGNIRWPDNGPWGRGCDINMTRISSLELMAELKQQDIQQEHLHQAVQQGDTAGVKALLNQGADVNARNHDGWTPLMQAVKNGRERTLRLLLNRGADVNLADNVRGTPLVLAVFIGSKETVRLLLDRGANVNISGGALEWTPLMVAAAGTCSEETLRLVLELPPKQVARIVADLCRNTPHISVAGNGDKDTVRMLIESGADVNAQGKTGLTALILSARKGNSETVRLLLDHGADPELTNDDGKSAADLAAKFPSLKRLLERTVARAIARKQGQKPPPSSADAAPPTQDVALAKKELAEIERKRQEEQARLAAEVERKRQEEQARLAAEVERKRQEEQARLVEEKRRQKMAQLRKQQEEARRRVEEEQRRQELALLAPKETRIALVIGNGEYRHPFTLPSLKNPPNDARGIAATLRKLGFDLIGGGVQLNLDRADMENAIIEFGEQLGEGTVGLFYYAGHGLAVNKTNYLIPVDTDKLTKKTVNIKMISADLVMDQFPRNGGMNIMILDACRNTPASLRGVRGNENEGLVQMNAPSGTLISYATQPGNVALDGQGRNSPYAAALMKMMQQPGVGVLEVFNDVGVEVEKNTDGFQRPWINSSPLEGKFYFKAGATTAVAPPQPATPAMSDASVAWQSIQHSTNPKEIEAFILAFRSSPFTGMARARLEVLKDKPQQTATIVVPPKPSKNLSFRPGQVFKDCPDCPEMVVIPAGSFMMGDLSGDGRADEKPVHRVTIPRKFAVGQYEVTQRQWQAVKGDNPSYFKGDSHPVEQVSWDDAQDFIRKLNAKTGQNYRLLSESEWEYVARAGTTTKYNFGNSISNNQASFNRKNFNTTPVGNYPSNKFGIYDIHGNVWEWVEDCYEENYTNAPSNGSVISDSNSCMRVMRGGSWRFKPKYLRSASRFGMGATKRDYGIGFRIARTL